MPVAPLPGVIETAEKSVHTHRKIIDLKARIEKEQILNMGKRTKKALELIHGLFTKPVVSVAEV